MNWQLMWDSLPRMLGGMGLTLQLIGGSLALGAVVAFAVALLRLSGNRPVEWIAGAYVFVFRGTPLLVQIFLIYYGLGQFEFVRDSILWPVLREPMWCAILALTLNTGAYTSEVLRGAILSVPQGQIEAARACGMSRALAFRRIVLPVAVRQMLPAYGNEVILMVKASSLASTITLMEITGIARRMIAQTFAVFELFIVAGAIYLILNFVASRLIKYAEWRLTPYLRARA
ncbi:ABC transporter permease [Azospirillum doebereinerae]|uniref:ABC transporter permease n=1 Tax=Azospirillum doebereinerae TaxID=92933 RepID=A0A3S1CHZ6_9PROT|nr:ABC transporter permease [Azospirillum doebereinerae]MCG5243350.1 ABC transporter permease [Azospirillum doebereinerae]RUQ73637.1 ABC transporter permease [Azospirillum doebereinerae]